MSLIALLVLALAVVPAFAFAAVGWLALAADADELDSFGGMPFGSPGALRPSRG